MIFECNVFIGILIFIFVLCLNTVRVILCIHFLGTTREKRKKGRESSSGSDENDNHDKTTHVMPRSLHANIGQASHSPAEPVNISVFLHRHPNKLWRQRRSWNYSGWWLSWKWSASLCWVGYPAIDGKEKGVITKSLDPAQKLWFWKWCKPFEKKI